MKVKRDKVPKEYDYCPECGEWVYNCECDKIDTLRRISECRNLNKWMYQNIEAYVGNNVVEIGSGIGNITEFFISKKKVIVVDISRGMMEALRKRLKADNLEFYMCDVTSRKILNLRKRNIDTIACLNVLEHIKNDKRAIKNMYDVLKKEGRLILLTPTIKWLYGNLDKNLGHHRRYSKKELVKLLQEAGFKIENVFYMNFFGIFGWFINDKILGRKILPKNQLLFYDKIAPIIKKIERIINLPIGLSIICIGKK